jgi:hypothetical protein
VALADTLHFGTAEGASVLVAVDEPQPADASQTAAIQRHARIPPRDGRRRSFVSVERKNQVNEELVCMTER